jgi:hypothetical protein
MLNKYEPLFLFANSERTNLLVLILITVAGAKSLGHKKATGNPWLFLINFILENFAPAVFNFRCFFKCCFHNSPVYSHPLVLNKCAPLLVNAGSAI